mmetsp:Transcript_43815/g.171349  ORF Transcript_43815/g.171349 Transcript_43815/m.171349 type:complete len:98 (+) Transcript_43815:203-496(+)
MLISLARHSAFLGSFPCVHMQSKGLYPGFGSPSTIPSLWAWYTFAEAYVREAPSGDKLVESLGETGKSNLDERPKNHSSRRLSFALSVFGGVPQPKK